MWVLFAILSAVLAALVAIFGKLGLKEMDSTLATTIRGVIMGLFLLGVSIVLKKINTSSLEGVGRMEWVYLISAGIAGALSWLFYFYALKNGPASKVAALDRTSIIFVILLGVIFLQEALGWKAIIGGLMIAGGAVLMVW